MKKKKLQFDKDLNLKISFRFKTRRHRAIKVHHVLFVSACGYQRELLKTLVAIHLQWSDSMCLSWILFRQTERKKRMKIAIVLALISPVSNKCARNMYEKQ